MAGSPPAGDGPGSTVRLSADRPVGLSGAAPAEAPQLGSVALDAAYTRIERHALDRTAATDRPQAVLLGGQPGSGKSGLAASALLELRSRGGAIIIDADRMREEHPAYKRLSITDPHNAADLTHKDAAGWASRLTLAAIGGQRNLVVDGTMRNPENLRELAVRLKDHGYNVEVRVMAVNRETSITRARLRFEEQMSARGTGRFVNQGQHDDAYVGIPRSIALLETERLVGRIRLFDAHLRPVYDNTLEGGEWRVQPGAAAALESERGRPWTRAERADYVSILETIAALAKQRLQVPDAAIEARLVGAREDLARFEASPVHLRSDAFGRLPMQAALAKHPELDGAYAHLREVMLLARPDLGQDARERLHFSARSALLERLERGEIPRGPVTVFESERVIALAGAERGIKSIRNHADLQRDVTGEVAATSAHHVLLSLSGGVGVRIETQRLDRAVIPGEAVTIQYRADRSKVLEVGDVKPRVLGRDQGGDFSR